MTKSTLIGAAALALIGTAAAAEVEFRESANFMLPGCRSFVDHKTDNPDRQGLCLGRGLNHEGMLARILLGLARKNGETGSTLEVLRTSLCINHPAEVTNGQMARVVTNYIESHPARMHEDFAVLALEALQAAWPCR
jgi:Rap1a immunity proteins